MSNIKILFMNKKGNFLRLGVDCADGYTSCRFDATGFTGGSVRDAHERVKGHEGKFVKINIQNAIQTDVGEEKQNGIIFFETSQD